MLDLRQRLETTIWSIVDGVASDEDLARFHDDERASLVVLDRLIVEAEDDLLAVRNIRGDEREQVVADFTDTLERLTATAARLRPTAPLGFVADPRPEPANRREPVVRSEERVVVEERAVEVITPGEVELQASWSAGQIVVWAAGRGTEAETNDALASRLESIDGPAQGWELHPMVALPAGVKAEALSIPVKAALGWLVAVAAAPERVGVGASVHWLGRVALEGVRLIARGSIVPSVKVNDVRGRGDQEQGAEAIVRWTPALLDTVPVDVLAAAMPGTVSVVTGRDARNTVIEVITAVVQAIVAESIERMELPAPPASLRTAFDLEHVVVAHMNGKPFGARPELLRDLSRRVDGWSRTVTEVGRTRLVVELNAPEPGGVWLLNVFASPSRGKLVAIDAALRAKGALRSVSSEWTRLSRLFPELGRANVQRRGHVALSQDEAWRFMTEVGPTLAAIGFDVRVPLISRRKARPALRLTTEATGTVVGAHQLSNVAWTVLFDDLELTADEIAKLARQARPLVQTRGGWVEVDRADLEQAAAALAERESITQLTGAEILRHSIGLGGGLAGGIEVHGNSWANDIVQRAGEISSSLDTTPSGFAGELRSYQAEALAWIGFLDAAELGGCLALDMGLGKTPTVLAHLARSAGDGKALVVAPAAVVGNWAAEAAKFAPGLKVVVHHGASRAAAGELEAAIERADIVITTYATAVRDVEALSAQTWRRMVLDEAQAIKNPGSDTSQQLRNLPARSRLALTGTPIENGLGDLWAILDFTNPGLVGPRANFIAQMSGDGEAALRALNGILLFRRTKQEPEVAAELPDKIDELDHCTMTPEQIGLYQAVLDALVAEVSEEALGEEKRKGAVLAAITALKQICNHPAAYRDDGLPLAGRSGKLARLEEIVESVFAAGERVLVFTHFASWGRRLAEHLSTVTGTEIGCYDGSLARGTRDRIVEEFQAATGPGALVLSLKAGGTGLNLTGANHVVLYDRWWNPAVEDQARDRAWRLGQTRTVISHRLVCPGTVDERVEEVVAGKRHIADLVLPKSSSIADLSTDQLRLALGLRTNQMLTEDDE